MLEGYCIKDEKSQTFGQPFFVRNVVTACRTVIQAATDVNTNLNKFSSDFSLYKICNFNDENGEIENAAPLLIVTVPQLLAQKGE